MTLWARLTWQAKDPAAVAGELARRLSVAIRPGGLVPGARRLGLGSAELEVRPWIREGPGDDPRTAGRLVLEPVPNGEEPPAAGGRSGTAASSSASGGARWSSSGRESELDPWLGPRPSGLPPGVELDADGLWTDEHLGARARPARGGRAARRSGWCSWSRPPRGAPRPRWPGTARDPARCTCGPAAGLDAWLDAARERGVTASSQRDGPFGAQVLLAGSPAGPHVIVTEGRTPVSAAAEAGTIAP